MRVGSCRGGRACYLLWQALFPSFGVAFFGRSRETCITRDRSAITHVTGQHLVYEHVCDLNADTNDTGQQVQHRIRCFVRRPLEPLPVCHVLDLVHDEAQAGHALRSLQPYWVAGVRRRQRRQTLKSFILRKSLCASIAPCILSGSVAGLGNTASISVISAVKCAPLRAAKAAYSLSQTP